MRPYLQRGELVKVLDEWESEPLPLFVAYLPNRHLSHRVRVFVDWLAALMAQHAPVAQRSA